MKASCCDQVTTCYAVKNVDGGAVGCSDYEDCVLNCTDDDCIKNTCGLAADPSVPPLFDAVIKCRDTNCKTQCPED